MNGIRPLLGRNNEATELLEAKHHSIPAIRENIRHNQFWNWIKWNGIPIKFMSIDLRVTYGGSWNAYGQWIYENVPPRTEAGNEEWNDQQNQPNNKPKWIFHSSAEDKRKKWFNYVSIIVQTQLVVMYRKSMIWIGTHKAWPLHYIQWSLIYHSIDSYSIYYFHTAIHIKMFIRSIWSSEAALTTDTASCHLNSMEINNEK